MKKRHGKAALAWTLVLCTAAGSAKIDAQAAGSQAAVSIGNDMVSIGNDYISREYSIADGHIKTAQIVNKRIGTNLVPQDGSQDFVITHWAKPIPQNPEHRLKIQTKSPTSPSGSSVHRTPSPKKAGARS